MTRRKFTQREYFLIHGALYHAYGKSEKVDAIAVKAAENTAKMSGRPEKPRQLSNDVIRAMLVEKFLEQFPDGTISTAIEHLRWQEEPLVGATLFPMTTSEATLVQSVSRGRRWLREQE